MVAAGGSPATLPDFVRERDDFLVEQPSLSMKLLFLGTNARSVAGQRGKYIGGHLMMLTILFEPSIDKPPNISNFKAALPQLRQEHPR